MNTKKILATVAVGALLISPVLALAQAATEGVSTVREAGTGKATGRLGGLPSGTTTPRAETREAVLEQVRERRGEILRRAALKMIERMEAATERLSKLADRLSSRIEKLKGKGIDTSRAEANLGIARTKIAEATTAIATAKSAIEAAVQAANADENAAKPRDAAKPVREALQKARDAVFAAHKALVNAISSLNAGTKKDGGATSTPAN